MGNLTKEDEDVFQKLQVRLGAQPEGASEGPTLPNPVFAVSKKQTVIPVDKSAEFRLVINGLTASVADGVMKVGEFDRWRRDYQKKIQRQIDAMDQDKPAYVWPPIAGAAARSAVLRKKTKIKAEMKAEIEARKPPDVIEGFIDKATAELDARGITSGFIKYATAEVKASLRRRIGQVVANYYAKSRLDELFSRMKADDVREVDGKVVRGEQTAKLQADVITALGMNVLLRSAPISEKTFRQSSTLALRTIAKQRLDEIRRGVSVSGLKQAGYPQEAEEAQRTTEAIGRIMKWPPEFAEQLRAETALRGGGELHYPLEQPKAIWAGAKLAPESAKFYGRHVITHRDAAMEQAEADMSLVFGRNWKDVFVAAYKQSDIALKLSSMGVITDGIDLRSGTLKAGVAGAGLFSPLDFVGHRGTAEKIGFARDYYKVYAGKQYSNFDDTAKTLQHLWETAGIKTDQTDPMVSFQKKRLHVKLLAERTRQIAAQAVTGAPAEPPLTHFEHPGVGWSPFILDTLSGVFEDVAKAWNTVLEAGKLSRGIPLVRRGSQWVGGLLADDPLISREIEDPVSAIELLPHIVFQRLNKAVDDFSSSRDLPAAVRARVAMQREEFHSTEYWRESWEKASAEDRKLMYGDDVPWEWRVIPFFRDVGRDVLLAGTGVADWLLNRPEDLIGFYIGGKIIKPLAAGMKAPLERIRQIRKIRGILPSLIRAHPTVGRQIARQIRAAARMPLAAESAARLEGLAAIIDDLTSMIRSGQSPTAEMVNIAAKSLREFTPKLAELENPTATLLQTFLHDVFSKDLKVPSAAKRLFYAIQRKIPPLNARQSSLFMQETRRLSAMEAERVMQIARDNPKVMGGLRYLRSTIRRLEGLDNPTKEDIQTLMDAQKAEVKLLDDFKMRSIEDLHSLEADFGTLAAEYEAGRYSPDVGFFKKLLGRIGIDGRSILSPISDYTRAMDWMTESAMKIIPEQARGLLAQTRLDRLYGALEKFINRKLDDLHNSGQQTEHLRQAGIIDEADAVASRVPRLKEEGRLSLLLGRLKEERLGYSQMKAHEARRIKNESVIWELVSKENPQFILDFMEANKELFPEAAATQWMVTLDSGEVVFNPKRLEDLKRMFSSPGLRNVSKSNREVFEALQKMPERLRAQAKSGLYSPFNITHVPMYMRGRILRAAQHQSQMNEMVRLYQLDTLAKAKETLTPDEQRQLVEAITIRNRQKVAELVGSHPWAAEAADRYLSGLPPPGENVQAIADAFEDFFGKMLEDARRSGRITRRQYLLYRDQPLREVSTSLLHTQPGAVKDKTVQKMVRETREETIPSSAGGLHTDVFGHLRRPKERFMLRRITRDGDELYEEFDELDQLQSRLTNLYGEEFAKRMEAVKWGSGGYGKGFKRLKNIAGDDVVLGKPLGEENLPDIDFAPDSLQFENQLRTAHEAIEDLYLLDLIQQVEGLGGYIMSPTEYTKKASSILLAKGKGLHDKFQSQYFKPSAHLSGELRLGKYSNYYFHKDALDAIVNARQHWEKIKTFLSAMTKWAETHNWSDVLLNKIPLALHEAAKVSLIPLSPRTYFSNFVYNFILSGISGARVFHPKTFARNIGIFRQFAAERAAGRVHPLEQEMIKAIGVQHGLLDVVDYPHLKGAFQKLLGLDDIEELYEHEDQLIDRLQPYNIDPEAEVTRQLQAQLAATKARIRDLEHGKIRRGVDELLHGWTRATDTTGAPKSRIGERIRRMYNSIDAWAKSSAWLNWRLDGGLTSEGAGQLVHLFFQDYARVPSFIRGLSKEPLLGSLVTSFPWELGRLTFNQMRYKPLHALALSSMVGAWNTMQFIRSGISPGRFWQLLAGSSYSTPVDKISSFFTSIKDIDPKTGNLRGEIGVYNTFYPFGDAFTAHGPLALMFDRLDPPDHRGIIGSLAEMGLGVATKFAFSAPIPSAIAEMVAGFRPGETGGKETWDLVRRGLLSKFLPPLTPYAGSQMLSLENAMDAGINDIGRPRGGGTVGDMLVRTITNTPMRGKVPIANAAQRAFEKAWGARFVPAKDLVDDEVIVKRAVYRHFIDEGGGWSPYTRKETLRRIEAQMALAKRRGDTEKLQELAKERRGKLEKAPQYESKKGYPKSETKRTKLEIRRLEASLDKQHYLWTYAGYDIQTQIAVMIDVEKQIDDVEHRDAALDGLASASMFSPSIAVPGARSPIRMQSDPEEVSRALSDLEARIVERGGEITPEGPKTTVAPYKRMWWYLVKQINPATIRATKEESRRLRNRNRDKLLKWLWQGRRSNVK